MKFLEKYKNKLFKLLRPLVHKFTDVRREKKIVRLINSRCPEILNTKLHNCLVIDLGSNRGDFLLPLAKRGAEILAFEPNKVAFKNSLKRLSKFEGINIFNVGVGNFSGITKFYFHKDAGNDPLGYSISSSIRSEKINLDLNNPVNIAILNFKDLLSSVGEVYVLKVDIEGAESEIWPAIKEYKNKIRYLFMEIHDQVNPDLRKNVEIFIINNDLSARWFSDWV